MDSEPVIFENKPVDDNYDGEVPSRENNPVSGNTAKVNPVNSSFADEPHTEPHDEMNGDKSDSDDIKFGDAKGVNLWRPRGRSRPQISSGRPNPPPPPPPPQGTRRWSEDKFSSA